MIPRQDIRVKSTATTAVVVLIAIGWAGGCTDGSDASTWTYGDDASNGGDAAAPSDTVSRDSERDTGRVDTSDGGRAPDAVGCPPPGGWSVRKVQKCGTTIYATEQQVRRTPRSDPNLELMVIDELGTVVAPSCVYDRVARDIGRIREEYGDGRLHYPDKPVRYDADHDGQTLLLQFDEDTEKAVAAGEYEAWDCLNDHYERTGLREADHLALEGTYDLEQVAESYKGLPGLDQDFDKTVRPDPKDDYTADQSDICFDMKGEVYHYVLVEGWGACNPTCRHHAGRYFTATRSGEIEKRGEYNPQTDEGPEPGWTKLCETVTFGR